MPLHPPLSYAVIGVGGVGGFYGALLQRAGQDVHFLLHSDYEYVRRHGLTISSVDGDFALPLVQAYDHPQAMPRCDVAIVALKATSNDILPAILPHVINEKGIVLLLQDGYGQEETIAALVGVKTVLAGLCFICTTKTAPGTICHQDYGSIILAQFTRDSSPAGITTIMQQIAADFIAAGVKVDMNADLIEARWRKLVWNIPFSGLTTLFNINTFQVVNSPPLRKLAQDLMREIMAGAAALGKIIPESFIEKMLTDTQRMRPYFPSMKLDFDACKPMELEAMYHNPLQTAAHHGQRLPQIEMLYEELCFLEENNLRGMPHPSAAIMTT